MTRLVRVRVENAVRCRIVAGSIHSIRAGLIQRRLEPAISYVCVSPAFLIRKHLPGT